MDAAGTIARPRRGWAGRTRGAPSGIAAKTLRDEWPAGLAVAGLLVLMCLAGGWTMATTYGTPTTRAELAALAQEMPPVLRGLYGNPVRIDTLGGFLSWHYGAYFALVTGLWSIVSLSGCLAGEARRGSLDVLLAAPIGRRRVAIEKVVGHVAALAAAMAVTALAAWLAGLGWATFPGDEVSPGAAVSFALGVGVRALVAGAAAFALAPVVGRGAAAGIAGAWMLAGYVIYSYRTVVPVFDTLRQGTWFSWLAGHLPLTGENDWAGLAATAVVAAVLIAVGTLAFARRDVGVVVAVPLPGLPRALAGTRGPISRTYGELLPSALAWGTGLGAYGLIMAASAPAVAAVFETSPGLSVALAGYFPGLDISTAAGMLQFAFVDLGYVVAGLAAASLVAARSADETAGRLELQLATPLGRGVWAVASAVGVLLALFTTIGVLVLAVAAGVALTGAPAWQPAIGTLILAAYAAALTGVGVAVAGVAGARFAGTALVATTVVTALVDLLAPALRLPGWIEPLALTHHLGQPILGTWDPLGLALCAGLGVGGILLGAWGMRRRDLAA